MQNIAYVCSNCGKRYQLAVKHAGRQVKCRCGHAGKVASPPADDGPLAPADLEGVAEVPIQTPPPLPATRPAHAPAARSTRSLGQVSAAINSLILGVVLGGIGLLILLITPFVIDNAVREFEQDSARRLAMEATMDPARRNDVARSFQNARGAGDLPLGVPIVQWGIYVVFMVGGVIMIGYAYGRLEATSVGWTITLLRVTAGLLVLLYVFVEIVCMTGNRFFPGLPMSPWNASGRPFDYRRDLVILGAVVAALVAATRAAAGVSVASSTRRHLRY